MLTSEAAARSYASLTPVQPAVGKSTKYDFRLCMPGDQIFEELYRNPFEAEFSEESDSQGERGYFNEGI